MVVPHVYADSELELVTKNYSLDGEEDELETKSDTISLESWSDTGWEELGLSGEIKVLGETVDRVISPKEGKHTKEQGADLPTRLVLAVDCPDTHHRFGTEVTGSVPKTGGNYSWELNLKRSVAYGELHIKPYLVRSRTYEENTRRFASYKGQRIADGKEKTVKLDGTDDKEDDLLDVEYKSFEDSNSIPDDNVYDTSFAGGDGPKVWVNSDHRLIKSVIDSGGHSEFRPRLRKVLTKWIAKNVTKDLLTCAISATRVEDGEYYWEEDWQEKLLKSCAEDILEESDVTGAISDIYQRFTEDRDMFPDLMVKMERHLQEDMKIDEPVTEFIQHEGPDSMSMPEEG